jgi:chromosome segregation ATPase
MSYEFSIGGYNIKGWMVAVGLPVLSSVAGGVWWSYDTLQRFYGVESGIQEVVDKSASFDKKAGELASRIQTLEQAVADNDVRGLNTKLAQLSTNMQQILEQQKILLDLRSQVDKATTITDGLGDTLDVLQTEIDDIWKAYDELADNPL